MDADEEPVTLDHLSGCEIEGAYKTLCAAMLLRSAQEFCVATQQTEEGYARKRAVRNWLFEGTGDITFREACAALNLAENLFLERLIQSAENLASDPKNNAAKVRNKFAIGSRNHADKQPSTAGADSTGMVAACAAGHCAGRL